MTINCTAAEHGGLKKKKRKKESSWAKLKPFPTNVRRPKKLRDKNYRKKTMSE